jgi:hypothetical protein
MRKPKPAADQKEGRRQPKAEAPKQPEGMPNRGSLGVLGNGQPRHSPSQTVGRLSQALKAEEHPAIPIRPSALVSPPIYAREMRWEG